MSDATQRLIRLLQATPEQEAAIDRILVVQESTPIAAPEGADTQGFDATERRLSLALDGLLNAIEIYREQKKGKPV